MGITIDALPPKEFTSNGLGVSCFLTGPGTSCFHLSSSCSVRERIDSVYATGRCTTPQEVFSLSGNTELGMAWMQQYPQYTHENLETQGTMFLTGATYYFVHEGHPAIQMLRTSQVHPHAPQPSPAHAEVCA